MQLYDSVKYCPMLKFCEAADGDLTALVIDGTPETEQDYDLIAETLEKLTVDYHDLRKSGKLSVIHSLSQQLEKQRLNLMIYDNCFMYLSRKDDKELREILSNSIYQINLPDFDADDYDVCLQREYKKLSRLRLQIKLKQDQLQQLTKDEMNSKTTATDSFYEMLQSLAQWQGFRDNPATITVQEYAIAETRFAEYVRKQQQKKK